MMYYWGSGINGEGRNHLPALKARINPNKIDPVSNKPELQNATQNYNIEPILCMIRVGNRITHTALLPKTTALIH